VSSQVRRRSDAHEIAVGLLAGIAVDHLLGDPQRGHPVAMFGTVASWIERRMWSDDRLAGAVYTGLLVGSAAGIGVVSRGRSGRGWLTATTAVGTWIVVGGRSLVAEARCVRGHLEDGDLTAARGRLTHLVGRRTEGLSESEIARATVESVAENASDAVVAPLFWGALAGLPGLLAYRAVNTLDAMVGHHNPRYERFGWASARLDDLANVVPARLTAGLAALLSPLVSGRAPRTLEVVLADGRQHPSPNAGVAEAAFAGALGVRLGGRNDYGSHVEDRPVLGASGRPAAVADIARAERLCQAVTVGAALVCAGIALARGRRP
jgi:adenosylcobinamide-phosphate synthase